MELEQEQEEQLDQKEERSSSLAEMPMDTPSFPLHSIRLRNCTSVFAWGRGDLGQLGIGDDSGRDVPTLLEAFSDEDVIYIAASDFHSAFLTGEGELYTTGSNDSGQLGTSAVENQLIPMQVAALDTQVIVHVACGQGHTVAVTDSGALASWGAAEFGQLGQNEAGVMSVPHPRLLKGSRELHFVRVACGATHTLALTGCGEVYSFGQGTFGALGHGNTEGCHVPTLIEELWGLGVVQVSCGENHSVALSVDGQVFTWGRGRYGQLGHSSVENETRPLQVKALADQMIVQVAAGGDHTITLNSDGEIFTWGRGHWGQTGLGTLDDVHTPRQVLLPKGEMVTQAAAGARHSITLTKGGSIFGWGDAEHGQVGKNRSGVQSCPCLIDGPMKANLQALFVVAGGEHSFGAFQHFNKRERGGSVVSRKNGLVDMDMSISTGTSSSLSSQIMHGNGFSILQIPALANMLEEGADSAKKMAVVGYAVEDIFSSARFLVLTFKYQPSFWQQQMTVITQHSQVQTAEPPGHGLNVDLIRSVYQRLLELRNVEILKKLGDAILHLFMGIERNMDRVPDSRWLRVLLIVLQSPFIGEKGLGDAISTKVLSVFSRVTLSSQKKITVWFQSYPRDVFGGRFVRGVLRYISNRPSFSSRRGIPQDITAAVKVLRLLHEANKTMYLIPYNEFYSKDLSESLDLEIEYVKWHHEKYEKELEPLVSFCQAPFLLTPQAKSKVLQSEAGFRKQMVMQASVFQHILGDVTEYPFLILTVRRTHLIQDTLRQLNEVSHPINYKKPLKVIIEGEEGVDEGGVTKEFFQLLCRELFNVAYGMFVYDDETRNVWFNSNSMETEHTFELVGLILGLGIYNNVILDIHMPLVVYKKMLGLKPKLDDLKDVKPHLAKSLQQLLDFEGDVENTFALTFQVSYDYFGTIKTYDLQSGGCDIPVTNENREKFVELYVNYILEESIKDQFASFNKGFQLVCGGPALSLFHYEELELVICGLPHYDFDALEKVTIYQGYTKDSQLIRWFWQLMKEMTLEEKKSLLSFTTGNDRAPVGGLGSLQFIIQRNDGNTDRLPTSHTCFNVLLLPEYNSKAKLENRLKLAISNSTGFGLQ